MSPRVLILSLCIGVLATYLIALRCFINGCVDQSMRNWTRDPLQPSPQDVAWFARHAPEGAEAPLHLAIQTLPGYEKRSIGGARIQHGSNPGTMGAVHYRAGWPCFAVAGEWGYWMPETGGLAQESSYGMISFKDKITVMPRVLRYIPYRPDWPGFTVNTLIYGAMFWLLCGAPMLVCRHFRIKRGLCPACAYPVGDSPVCTECGRPVSRSQ